MKWKPGDKMGFRFTASGDLQMSLRFEVQENGAYRQEAADPPLMSWPAGGAATRLQRLDGEKLFHWITALVFGLTAMVWLKESAPVKVGRIV